MTMETKNTIDKINTLTSEIQKWADKYQDTSFKFDTLTVIELMLNEKTHQESILNTKKCVIEGTRLERIQNMATKFHNSHKQIKYDLLCWIGEELSQITIANLLSNGSQGELRENGYLINYR